MGNEQSQSPDSNPFAQIQAAKPKKAVHVEETHNQTSTIPGPHKSAAQRRLEEKALNSKAWVYKNEKRSGPTEIRTPSGRILSSRGRVETTGDRHTNGVGAKDDHDLSREEKQAKEQEEFMRRVSNFMENNVAIRPKGTAKTKNLPRLPVLPSVQGGDVPAVYKQNWVQKLMSNRETMLKLLEARPDKDKFLEPQTEADVGTSVEKSLGSAYEQFSTFQRALNKTVEEGLSEDLLGKLLDDKPEGQEAGAQRVSPKNRRKSVEEQWEDVGAAVEGVMQVYVNRSNSRFIMHEEWRKPDIIQSHSNQVSVYARNADSLVAQGHLGLLLIDSGHLVEIADDGKSYSAVLSTDLWQAVKAMCPGKVPSTQRLERVSLLGRHLLQACVDTEEAHGKGTLNKLKVVLAVDEEQGYFVLSELRQWSFFGLNHANVLILPLPRFPGYGVSQKGDGDVLAPVENSPKILYGAGYAVCLLNAPAVGYTLDAAGSEPAYLPGSALEWLKAGGVTWLKAGVFYDTGSLKHIFDRDFMAGALYASEQEGANMAVQVIKGTDKRQVRHYNSILLGRKPHQEGGPIYTCDLCSSNMRTVRSYQVLQAQLAEGFHVSTHRYMYKLSSLFTMLHDTSSVPMDLLLHGYYSYGTMKLNSITCLPEAKCVAVECDVAPGPPQEHAVLGAQWLHSTADILYQQDKVDTLRRKAISLVDFKQLDMSMVVGVPKERRKPGRTAERLEITVKPSKSSGAAKGLNRGSKWTVVRTALALSGLKKKVQEKQAQAAEFQEKRQGQRVLLLVSLEHRGLLAKAALKLAKLSVREIVDQLHVHVVRNASDSQAWVDEVLQDLTDKELEFNGQLKKSWVLRAADLRTADAIWSSVEAVKPDLVVVPDSELGEKGLEKAPPMPVPSKQGTGAAATKKGANSKTSTSPTAAVGLSPAATQAASSSFAMLVARTVTTTPVLVVKHNAAGRFAFEHDPHHPKAAAGHYPLTILVNMGILGIPVMVKAACRFASYPNDKLLLGITRAFEAPGQPSMRTRRMLVKGRMAVSPETHHEERLLSGYPVAELPKVADAEGVDIVMVSTAGELPISKETEELMLTAKASILIFRDKELQGSSQAMAVKLNVVGGQDDQDEDEEGAAAA